MPTESHIEEIHSIANSAETKETPQQNLVVMSIHVPGVGYVCERHSRDSDVDVVTPPQFFCSGNANPYRSIKYHLQYKGLSFDESKEAVVCAPKGGAEVQMYNKEDHKYVEVPASVYSITLSEAALKKLVENDFNNWVLVPETAIMQNPMDSVHPDFMGAGEYGPDPEVRSFSTTTSSSGAESNWHGIDQDTTSAGLTQVKVGNENKYVMVHPNCSIIADEAPIPITPDMLERKSTDKSVLAKVRQAQLSILRKIDNFTEGARLTARDKLQTIVPNADAQDGFQIERVAGESDRREPVILGIEAIDKSKDRLTLKHIERIGDLLSDEDLARDLKDAYLKERIYALAVSQLGAITAESGTLKGIMNDESLLALLSVIGVAYTQFQTEGKLGEVYENESGDNLKKLLMRALNDLNENYPLLESHTEGIETQSTLDNYIVLLQESLSDPQLLKSPVIDTYVSTAVRSSVFLAGGAPVAAAANTAIGALTVYATNKLQERYATDEKFRMQMQDDKALTELLQQQREKQKGMSKIRKGIAGITALTRVAPAAFSAVDFIDPKLADIAINAFSYYVFHEFNSVPDAEASVKRRKALEKLNHMLEWADKEAELLVSQKKFEEHCRERVRELRRAGSRDILFYEQDLFNTSGNSINGVETKRVRHNPLASNRRKVGNGYALEYDLLSVVESIDFASPVSKDALAKAGEDANHNLRQRVHEIQQKLAGETDPIIVAELRQELSLRLQDLKENYGKTLPFSRLRHIAAFCDVSVTDKHGNLLLANASFVCEPGSVTLLEGDVNEDILRALAGHKKTQTGTAYIRTPTGDVNMHAQADRDEFTYFDCDKMLRDKKNKLFEGEDPQKIMEFLDKHNFFKLNVLHLRRDKDRLEFVKEFMRDSSVLTYGAEGTVASLLTLAEAVYRSKQVCVINNPFSNINNGTMLSEDRETITNFLINVSYEKNLIMKHDKERTLQHFEDILATRGHKQAFVVENAYLKLSAPTISDYQRELLKPSRHTGLTFPEARKLATELYNQESTLEVDPVTEEVLRKQDLLIANIYTVDPENGDIYMLKQQSKGELRGPGQRADYEDRSDTVNSIQRSLRGSPWDTLRTRLAGLRIGIQDKYHEDEAYKNMFQKIEEPEPTNSATYKTIKTKYTSYCTTVEVPFGQHPLNEPIVTEHDRNTFSTYVWVKVDKLPDYTRARVKKTS